MGGGKDKLLPDAFAQLRKQRWVAVDEVEVDQDALADRVPNPPLHILHGPHELSKPPSIPI
jgi:hypothetical protein